MICVYVVEDDVAAQVEAIEAVHSSSSQVIDAGVESEEAESASAEESESESVPVESDEAEAAPVETEEVAASREFVFCFASVMFVLTVLFFRTPQEEAEDYEDEGYGEPISFDGDHQAGEGT